MAHRFEEGPPPVLERTWPVEIEWRVRLGTTGICQRDVQRFFEWCREIDICSSCFDFGYELPEWVVCQSVCLEVGEINVADDESIRFGFRG